MIEGVLAFEAVDLVDQQVDLVVLGLHFRLKFGVTLLQLSVLFGLSLGHHCSLLVEALDLAAEDDDLEGELVGESLLLLQLLLRGLESSLVALDVCTQSHDVVLGKERGTCCSWSEISISPLRLNSGSRREY